MPDWQREMPGSQNVAAAPVTLEKATVMAISRHFRRSMGPAALFAALAAKSLLEEAQLDKDTLSNGRIGCIASSTLGSSTEIYASAMSLLNGSFFDQSACQFFKIVSHSTAFNIANMLGINGVQLAPCSACASSLQSIGLAYEQLLLGKQDAFIAGGSDEVTRIVLESFRLLHALAANPEMQPQQLSRPFDSKRCGLVCGEGAALLAIETLENAQKRNATPLAEIIGYATNCTGSQISQSDANSIKKCMELALEDAGIQPKDVDYISAHATSTLAGDKEEAAAIRELFGTNVPVSSLKGQLGHTLGASGALETAVVLDMMKHNVIIPTANLVSASEDCQGIFLPTAVMNKTLNIVLKNCIAFGGVNASLVLRKL